MNHVTDTVPSLFIKVATKILQWAFQRIEDEGHRLGIAHDQIYALIADITVKHFEASEAAEGKQS